MSAELRERLDKSLEIALDNRKFEIDLLWRRTLIFWGFISVLFLAVARAIGNHPTLVLVLSVMGALLSLIWTLVNRASKSWQESWEIKAGSFFRQRYSYDKLFKRATEPQSEIIPFLRPVDYSVSRLLIALSDLSVIFWSALSTNFLLERAGIFALRRFAPCVVAVFAIVYAVYVVVWCRGRSTSTLTEDV